MSQIKFIQFYIKFNSANGTKMKLLWTFSVSSLIYFIEYEQNLSILYVWLCFRGPVGLAGLSPRLGTLKGSGPSAKRNWSPSLNKVNKLHYIYITALFNLKMDYRERRDSDLKTFGLIFWTWKYKWPVFVLIIIFGITCLVTAWSLLSLRQGRLFLISLRY